MYMGHLFYVNWKSFHGCGYAARIRIRNSISYLDRHRKTIDETSRATVNVGRYLNLTCIIADRK
jgi:hypothetical protein